jgi:hypothetical protein
MPIPPVSIFVLTVAIAFTASCGGAGDQADLVSASKCLVRVNGATVDFVTPLHEAMSGGGVRVMFPSNEVQLGFGKDGDEARKIGGEARQVASGTIAGGEYPPDELVAVRKNVALVWTVPPSQEERSEVEGCLK